MISVNDRDRAATWLLRSDERGNRATDLDARQPDGAAWSCGNLVHPLIDGAEYFRRLSSELADTSAGDEIYFARGSVTRPSSSTVPRTLLMSGLSSRELFRLALLSSGSFGARIWMLPRVLFTTTGGLSLFCSVTAVSRCSTNGCARSGRIIRSTS